MAQASTDQKESTALAVFREMRDVLAPFPTAKFHHLIPTAFQERSDLWRPAVSVVQVDPEDARDVYDTPGSSGKTVCLHSQALERIGNAMGIEWADTRYEHDHAREPFICIAFVSGWVVDSLGMRRRLSASAKSDLRDGSVAAKISHPKQLDVARQYICERTESRARNRAIKKVGDVPTSFTKDELKKPFVAVRFRLDEREPDVRKALIAQGTQRANEVFGLPAGEPIDAGHAGPEDEVIAGEFTERGDSSVRAESSAPAEQPTSGGEAAGSSPAPRSAAKDPEPVEEETTTAPTKPAVVDADRAAAIRAHVEEIRKKAPLSADARKKVPTPQQAGLSVSAIAAAVGGSKLTVEQKKTLWRAVAEFLFGEFGAWDTLSNDRMGASIEWAKGSPGEVKELVAFLASTNERVAEVRTAVEGQQQLIGGAA